MRCLKTARMGIRLRPLSGRLSLNGYVSLVASRSMTPREITSAMRRLFRFETGGQDAWRHLMINGAFNAQACEALLKTYISEDEVIVFVDVRHAVQCSVSEAARHIESFMRIGRVRVANLSFTSRVIVDPIGVGQGYSSQISQSH